MTKPYQIISPQEATDLYKPYHLNSDRFAFDKRCILYPENTELDADLDFSFILELHKETGMDKFDIIFQKDLTIKGRLNLVLPGNRGIRLFVLGNLRASTIENDFSLVQVCGNADIDCLIYGFCPEGLTEIRGKVNAPFLINSTIHEFRLGELSKKTVTIKTYRDHEREDWEKLTDESNLSYQLDGYLEKLLVRELVDWDELIVDKFVEFYEQGKAMFK